MKRPIYILLALGLSIFIATGLVESQTATSSRSSAGAIETAGSAPTVSACGTSPTVVTGNNYAGRLTAGSGLVASCTLTFVPAFSVAPVCVVSMTNAPEALQATTTTTTLVITGADITSNGLAYICAKVP